MFPKHNKTKTGYYSWCKECTNTKAAQLRKRKGATEKHRNYLKSNPLKVLLYAAKTRAKKSGLEFDIEESDISVPDTCPILNIPLIKGTGKVTENSPSIDRIDSSKGYVKGNIHVISFKANTMKSNASVEDLIKFAKWINMMYNQ